jgi:hypothetical protein
VVGANGFEPSTSWSRIRVRKTLNCFVGVAYGKSQGIFRSLRCPEVVPKNWTTYLGILWPFRSLVPTALESLKIPWPSSFTGQRGYKKKSPVHQSMRTDGLRMTWTERAKIGVDAKHFQAALAAKGKLSGPQPLCD